MVSETSTSRAVPETRAPHSLTPSLPGDARLSAPDLGALSKRRLRAMLMAGTDVLECRRVLSRGDINLVGEVLRGQGEFVEYEHYPANDVHDPETGAQYYYHAHRGGAAEEHGHFHTFLRWHGNGLSPAAPENARESADKPDHVTHLIAISMDAYGWPIGLFATNRWVTGEFWVPAERAIEMLPRFNIDHAYPSWPVNRWIGAMMVLYRPHIEALLRQRDQIISEWVRQYPESDVPEDRNLEITGYLPISVEETVRELRTLAGASSST